MVIERAASAATYAGAGTSVLFGLTPGEWQAIGVLAGIVVGVIGLLVNVVYKHRHYLLAERQANRRGDWRDEKDE